MIYWADSIPEIAPMICPRFLILHFQDTWYRGHLPEMMRVFKHCHTVQIGSREPWDDLLEIIISPESAQNWQTVVLPNGQLYERTGDCWSLTELLTAPLFEDPFDVDCPARS